MKTSNSLDNLPGIKTHRLPTMLRATVTGLLLASLPVQASEPDRGKAPNVAMIMNKRGQNLEEARANAFAEGLKRIYQTKNETEAKKLWLKLAMIQPTAILRKPELIPSPFLVDTLNIACEALADKEPDIFLEQAINCTDVPDYLALVMTAAKNASETKPEAAVEFRGRYETLPEGQKTFERALENIRKKTAGVILKASFANPQSARFSK